ncbi:hypothetical protein NXC14_CH02790 [Rhizobium sp. NXC14]|nr:hypothetical protein NXC14_CH02790 [Rhizobium sp. NXC14]
MIAAWTRSVLCASEKTYGSPALGAPPVRPSISASVIAVAPRWQDASLAANSEEKLTVARKSPFISQYIC